MTATERTRLVVRTILDLSAMASLGGAALAGVWFAGSPMDLALIQLVFYGAWACLVGAFLGGALGAALEEDACGELDMGTMSSMGGIFGTLSAGLLGTALTGLVFTVPWQAVLGVAVALEGMHLAGRRWWPWRLVRSAALDDRGRVLDAAGRRLPDDRQPLRMRDRVAILLAVGAGVMLALTLVMALMMGSDLGHPVMMAPMMYGMFGTMLGGMLGGWLAGLLDEHTGAEHHDNPVMVGAMALMAGMMGGMPSGMIGGMMAVMGNAAIGVTVVAGLLLPVLMWVVAVRGRYRFERRGAANRAVPPGPVGDTVGSAVVRVGGMTCGACVDKVQRGVAAVPGVGVVAVDLADGSVTLRWRDGFPGIERVREVIADLGYTS